MHHAMGKFMEDGAKTAVDMGFLPALMAIFAQQRRFAIQALAVTIIALFLRCQIVATLLYRNSFG